MYSLFCTWKANKIVEQFFCMCVRLQSGHQEVNHETLAVIVQLYEILEAPPLDSCIRLAHSALYKVSLVVQKPSC